MTLQYIWYYLNDEDFMSNKSQAVSFRLDNDLGPTVNRWLKHHPSLTMSRLANLAIRSFVTHDQVLRSIETVTAKKSDVKATLKKMMEKHKKTLDELK